MLYLRGFTNVQLSAFPVDFSAHVISETLQVSQSKTELLHVLLHLILSLIIGNPQSNMISSVFNESLNIISTTPGYELSGTGGLLTTDLS